MKKNTSLKSAFVDKKRLLIKTRLTGLIGFAMLLFGLLWGCQSILDPGRYPITNVGVDGVLKHLSIKRLKQTISSNTVGGFFNIDVGLIKQTVGEMPWVESVTVRRVWPDRIQVTVHEQRPIVRWGNGALLNSELQKFTPLASTIPIELPTLLGPVGSEQQMMTMFDTLTPIIKEMKLKIAELVLNDRRSWRVKLNNGIELVLGQDPSLSLLESCVVLYKRLLEKDLGDIASIDLRYANGFAVHWQKNSRGEHNFLKSNS